MKLQLSASVKELAAASDELVNFNMVPVMHSAELMVNAYQGTVDWEDGDDISVATEEIEKTIKGGYGEFLPYASFALCGENGLPQAEIACSLMAGIPTILFIYTHPTFKRQGLAEMLIRASAAALDERGFERFQLFVTDINPAVSLYRKLGFGG